MTVVVNDGQVVEPFTNTEAYLTPEAVHACVLAFNDHQIEQLWRSHNVTAHWVPTIKYPPFFMEQLLAKALPTIRQKANTEAAVAWILKCRKVWSIKSAAMFIIRLTLAKFLYDMVQPEAKPAKALETPKITRIGLSL